jgi:hypothetical protein
MAEYPEPMAHGKGGKQAGGVIAFALPDRLK